MSLVDRVRALLGSDAVDLAATPDGVPRVAPASPDAVALLLGTAREEGWRLRIEGAGTWLPADAPADLALTTRRLDKIPANSGPLFSRAMPAIRSCTTRRIRHIPRLTNRTLQLRGGRPGAP